MNQDSWIPLEECEDGKLYLINARNFQYGIFNAEKKGFEGARFKWHPPCFIDIEYHWDVKGSAKPMALTPVDVPEFQDKKAKVQWLEAMEHNDTLERPGAIFIDLDGTVLNWSTGELCDGAYEKLKRWHELGFKIYFTTARGDNWHPDTPYSIRNTAIRLEELGVSQFCDQIIWDVPSPRIIMNDEGAIAINHPKNGSWVDYPEFPADYGLES
jgi:hypothetical protein